MKSVMNLHSKEKEVLKPNLTKLDFTRTECNTGSSTGEKLLKNNLIDEIHLKYDTYDGSILIVLKLPKVCGFPFEESPGQMKLKQFQKKQKTESKLKQLPQN